MKLAKIMFVLLLSTACQESSIQDNREKTVGGQAAAASDAKAGAINSKFKLSWSDQAADVTAYHVFYNKDKATNTGGAEIDSITATDADLSKPELIIDKTNMASFPPAGSKICFYIVAENEGAMSDPSDAACLKL